MSAAASNMSKFQGIITVAIGSKNPCKVESVQLAFSQAFPQATLSIHPFNVPSGVSDQPFGDEETTTGATNRAQGAANAYNEEKGEQPDFSVGLEGGVGSEITGYSCFAYMAIQSSLQPLKPPVNPSVAKTASFMLPPQITQLMKQDGLELGDASDKVFSRTNSKHAEGTVGLLSGGVVSRAAYYQQALSLALAPFLPQNACLYEEEASN